MQIRWVLVSIFMWGFYGNIAQAKPEFAARVAHPCSFCHLDSDGGGPRNQVGQLFESNGFEFPLDFDMDDPDSYFTEQIPSEVGPQINFALDLRTAYIKPTDVNPSETVLANCQSCHTSQDTFLLMKGEVSVIQHSRMRISPSG